MQPTMNMNTSAMTLNMQTNLEVAKVEETIYKDYHLSNKTWPSFPTSLYTTTAAEGLIISTIERELLHTCKRVDSAMFEVSFCGGCNDERNFYRN